jgi:ADP-glucose pyrophosphorylase
MTISLAKSLQYKEDAKSSERILTKQEATPPNFPGTIKLCSSILISGGCYIQKTINSLILAAARNHQA